MVEMPRWPKFVERLTRGIGSRWSRRRARKQSALQTQAQELVNLTLQRDKIIDSLVQNIQIKPGEEEHQYLFRRQSARGMAFNDSRVVEIQKQINSAIQKFSKQAKTNPLPLALEKALGPEFKVKNLGWSGRQMEKFGKTAYPDLGIYLKKKN